MTANSGREESVVGYGSAAERSGVVSFCVGIVCEFACESAKILRVDLCVFRYGYL